MCLAVPAEIVSLDDSGFADVDMGGVRHRACVDLVPHVRLGDFVIVHAGFAISVLDPAEAEQTLDLFRQLNALTQTSTSLPHSLA